MQNALHEMKNAQTTREIVFTVLAIVVALIAAAAAVVLDDISKRAGAASILFVLFLALLFCRLRASNCANALGLAIYLESTNVKAAHQTLRSSDCIKNADAIIGMLGKIRTGKP